MKSILLAGLLLALAVPAAFAGGVDFGWGTVCYTESLLSSRTFACNTNSGRSVMTASFTVDAEMPDFVGVAIQIVGQSYPLPLPDWWKVGSESSDCRRDMAWFDADFSAVPQTDCHDWTAGRQRQTLDYHAEPNYVEITATATLDSATTFHLQPWIEYYAGRITILHQKTVGTDACTGCSTMMMWDLYSITVTGLDGRRDELLRPLPGGNDCLGWNGGNLLCPEVPARTTTWGQIKSMYR
jgi:hypothetical protein